MPDFPPINDYQLPWYQIDTPGLIDSPALLLYPDRIARNIDVILQMAGNAGKLRVHVKTNKTPEVCRMMLAAGISKYKCATIAEAEMLGQIGAPDVLLAYQPVGPKITRLMNIVKAYPQTQFSCLVDNVANANEISQLFAGNRLRQDVFIDLNVGMNRTGIVPAGALRLMQDISGLDGIRIIGLHAYDGHIHDTDMDIRTQKANEAFEPVRQLADEVERLFSRRLTIIAGGTPTFPIHLRRDGVECSPGTFVFWDWGYHHMLPEQPFEYAALLLTRVISIVDAYTICIDLGHKSVAAENPLPRIHFLNAVDAEPIAQSEEHLTLRVPDSSSYRVGDVLYGVPVHICPTVALYEKAFIIKKHNLSETWNIVARNRYINF